MPMTMMSSHRRAVRTAGAALALAAGLCLSGCWVPGGIGVSLDMYTYYSTTYMPQTVTVIDTRTDQALFSVDIPVGKELVMQFHEGRGVRLPDGTLSELYPDLMKWDIWELGRTGGQPSQSFNVPPSYSRRVDLTVRTPPEQPEVMNPVPTTPAPMGDPTIAPQPGHEVPAPQHAPSAPPPPAPPGPGKPAGVGD